MKIRTSLIAVISGLMLLIGLMNGAGAESRVLYTNPDPRDYQNKAEVQDYLWDGSAVLLRVGQDYKLLYTDKPGKLVDTPWKVLPHWILRDEKGWQWPIRFQYLEGSRMLAARALQPDLSELIVGAWPLAHTGYQPEEGWSISQFWRDNQPVCAVYHFEQEGEEYNELARFEIQLTGLKEKCGVRPDEDGRFTVMREHLRATPEDWREFVDKHEKLTIRRASDGRKFHFKIGPEQAGRVVFHPTLDLAAVSLSPRYLHVEITNKTDRSRTGGTGLQLNAREFARMMVIDLRGFKPEVHYLDMQSFTPKWHPTEPVLYIAGSVVRYDKQEGRQSMSDWDFPEVDLPQFHYRSQYSWGVLAWNVDTGAKEGVLGFDLQNYTGSTLALLPNGDLVFRTRKSIMLADACLPEKRDNPDRVIELAKQRLSDPVSPSSRKPFEIAKAKKPTTEDPGRWLWTPIPLADGSGMMLNSIRFEPGETAWSSALDCEFAILGWDGEIKTRHKFPNVRGTWQIREINEDGLRFERLMLPEEGSTTGHGYKADISVFFDNEGNLLREEQVLPREQRPRFEIRLSDEKIANSRIADICFIDAGQNKHWFKELAGIDESHWFLGNVNCPLPRSIIYSSEPEPQLIGILPCAGNELQAHEGTTADYYVWWPGDDRVQSVGRWSAAEVPLLKSGQSYLIDDELNALLVLRSAIFNPEAIDYVPGGPGMARGVRRGEAPPDELVRIDLTSGKTTQLTRGVFSTIRFDDGKVFLGGVADGEQNHDIWMLDPQGEAVRLTDSPEVEATFRTGRGVLDYRLANEGSGYPHRVNLITLKRSELPKDLQGG